jgi:hypothetical protein
MYKGEQITDIFEPEQLKNAILLQANLLETSLFINDGTGQFSRKPLPVEVQFSPVMAAESGDYNKDGNLDLLLGGNLYHVKPEVGRYDASYGNFLLGDGQGGFLNIPPPVSGFRLEGEVRDLMEVNTPLGVILVATRSNDALQLFEMQNP